MDLSSTANPSVTLSAWLYNAEDCIEVYYQNSASSAWTKVQSLPSRYDPGSYTYRKQHESVSLPVPTATYRIAFRAVNAILDEVVVGPGAEVLLTGVEGTIIETIHAQITPPQASTPGQINLVQDYEASLTNVTPLFLGHYASVTPTGPQNFSNGSILYTFTSPDGSHSAQYEVRATRPEPGHNSHILGVTFEDKIEASSYETVHPTNAQDTGTIRIVIPYSYDRKNFGWSHQKVQYMQSGATSSYTGDIVNSDMVITCTAQDGTTKSYYQIKATWAAQPSAHGEVTRLTLCDNTENNCVTATQDVITQNSSHGSIPIVMPYSADLEALQVKSYGIAPLATAEWSVPGGLYDLDFTSSSPPYLTVTAENGNMYNYYLDVTRSPQKSTIADIEAFELYWDNSEIIFTGKKKQQATATTVGKIIVPISMDTDLSGAQSYWTTSGHYATVVEEDALSWNSATTRRFSVYAEDGVTRLQYDVSLERTDLESSTSLYSFSVCNHQQICYTSTIDSLVRAVTIQIPYYEPLGLEYKYALAPWATLAPYRYSQYADFTLPQEFTVVSPDKTDTAVYTVTVVRAQAPAMSSSSSSLETTSSSSSAIKASSSSSQSNGISSATETVHPQTPSRIPQFQHTPGQLIICHDALRSVEIFSADGQRLRRLFPSSSRTIVPLTSLPKGLLFVRTVTRQGPSANYYLVNGF